MKINISDKLKEILKLETNEIDENYINSMTTLRLDFSNNITDEVLAEVDRILEVNNEINIIISNYTLKDEKIALKNLVNITLSDCDIYDINAISENKNLKKIEIKNREFYIDRQKMLAKKESVLEKYPDFNNLTYSERYKILEEFDCLYNKCINLDGARDFENLESISIWDENKKYLTDELIESISNIKSLKNVRLNNIGNVNLEPLKKCENLEEIDFYFKGVDGKTNEEFFKSIENFKKLKSLSCSNVDLSNVSFNIPEDIDYISLTKCNITKLFFDIENCKNLKSLHLESNDIDMDSLDELYKLKLRGVFIDIKNTTLETKLKSEEIKFDSEALAEKVKESFNISKEKKITQYDIFKKYIGLFRQYDIKEILELKKMGIYDKVKEPEEDVSFKISKHSKLEEEEIEFLRENDIETIEVSSPTILDDDMIELLEKKGIEVEVIDDCRKYNFQELKMIRDKMLEIESIIMQKETESKKVLEAYKIIGKSMEYDDCGCHGDENFTFERGEITRSLYGAFVEGKVVCMGYSLALSKILKDCGTNCIMVGGYAYDNPDFGHEWNQVMVDGQWYNCDVTWDSDLLKSEKDELKYFLKSDEEFKDHTATEEAQICNKSFNFNSIINDENILTKLNEQVEEIENYKLEDNEEIKYVEKEYDENII